MLACVYLALSHDYAMCLFRREDYRYIRKVIDHTETARLHGARYDTYVRAAEKTNRENRAENPFRQPGTVQNVRLTCVVESIIKLGQYFTIASDRLFLKRTPDEMLDTAPRHPGTIMFLSKARQADRKRQAASSSTAVRNVDKSVTHLETATQVYTSVVPSIDM